MDSQLINEPPDISYLIRNIPITEITSTLQFLQKKTSQDLHNKILDINKLLSNINNAKNEMNDYELMYLYHSIRSLSTTLKTSEDNVLLKLKNIKNEYRCNKCKKKIKICHGWSLLDNLQNHACDQLIMPLGDRSGYNILRLKEYDLYKTIHYDYSIKEELFFKKIATNGKQVYLYTIYVFVDCFVCLVCECDISGTNNVLQHVFGQRHLQNLNTQYEIVKIFHSNFAKMESEHKLLQREFSLVDALKVECDRCTRKILYTNLLNHLKNGKCFKDKIETTATQAATIYNKTSFSEPSSPAQSSVLDNVQCNQVKYDNLIKKTIYKDLLEWYMVIDNVRYPILQNIENKVYCLVCSTYISRSISAHIDSWQHIESLTENNMRSIQKYHKIWSVQPVNVQIEQVHFRRRENKITCTACSDFMSYNSQILLNHVESPSHKMYMMRKTGTSRSISVESRTHMNNQSSGSVSSRSTSVEAEGCTSSVSSTSSTANKTTATQAATIYNKTSFSEPSSPAQSSVLGKIKIAPYDKTVFDELYPDGLMHFTVSIGPIKYPTIIKRGIYKHCFICNIDIPTAVLLHANSSQHEESLISEHRRDLLKKFHDLWLDLPSTDQCRQVLFNVNDNLTCMLCNKGLAYDIKELKSHLDSWEHVQNVMSTYYDKSPTKKQDTNNLDGIPATDDSVVNLATTGNQAKSPNENVKNTSIKSPEKVNKLKTELRQDLLIDLEPNTTIENEDTNSKATLNTPDKTKGNPGIKLGSIIYSKQTINELYGEELIHYSIRIDNVKYPFIQNMGNYKRCIICNIDIISSVLFHINSTPHIDSSNDSKKMDQLKRYHELWLNFPESDQLEQKYFEIGEKLTCAPCQKELNYDFEILNSHIFSIGHGNQVWTLNKPSSKPLVLTENGEIAEEVDELTDEENLLSSLSEEEITSADNDNSPTAQLSSESEFLNKSYDQIILDTVYLNLSQYRLKENDQELFYLQNRDGAIYCLLCENKFTDIAEHIAQTSHLSRCKDLVISGRLKCFHEIFLQLPTLYQKQQIYFKPKTHMITCLLCGTNCYSCEDVVEHLVKKGHTKILKNRKKILRRNAAREVYNKEPLNNTYDQTVLDTIYLNLTQYTVTKNNESLLYLQNRNGTVYCLMCRGTLTNITEHVVQISHVSRSEDLNILGMIKHFHEVFLKLPPSLQLEQIYFKPKKKRLTCVKCSVSYNFADIGAHLASKIHRRLLNGSGTNLAKSIVDSVDDSCCINQELPIKSYDQTVLDTVYLNLTQYTLMEGKQSLLYLQNRNGTIYCLICRKELTNITKHLAEVHHLLKSKSPANLEMTKHFHKIFSQLPPVFQKEQIYFRPKYGSHTCLLCGDLNFSQYDDIEQHLLSVRHRKLTMKDANKLSRYEADIFYDDRSVNKVIKTPEGNIVKETENYQFSQETNCVNYDIFSAMPPDDCTSSPAAEIVKTKNIQKPLAQETNTRVVNIFESLDSNNYFSQESNCVKYYVYSTILSGTSNLPAATKSSTNKRQFREKANNSTCAVISPGTSNDVPFTEIEEEPPRKIPDAEVLAGMYPQKINEEVRKMNCLNVDIIQASPNNKFTCMICLVEVDKPTKHALEVHHQARLQDLTTYIEPVRSFHQVWNYMDDEFKVLQNLFFPIAPTVTFCTTCCFNLNYSYLLAHLKQCHSGMDVELQEKLNTVFIFVSKKEYFPKVRNILYKDNVPQCDLILESTSYPVIQTYNTMRCLLCYKEVLDNKYIHLSSSEHKANMLSITIKRRLKRYHDIWLDGDEDFQMQQIYFERDGPSLYCKVCLADLSTSDLREHIRSDSHNNSLKTFVINERISGNAVFQDIEIMPQLDNDKDKGELMQVDECYTDSESDEDSEAVMKHYNKAVLEEFYPDFNNHHLTLDNIRYPIFRKTVVGFKCMICKRNPEVTDINQHLILESHKTKIVDRTAQNKFKKFHDFWLRHETSIQMHQKYFHRMKCIPCDVQVEYEAIATHVQTQEHEKNISLPFLRNENEDCSDKSLKPVTVPSSVSYSPSTSAAFKNQDSNREGSPLKETVKNKEKLISVSKAGSSKKSGHKIKKSVQNPKDPIIINQIPLRYAEHKKFLIMDKNDNIFCKCCSKKLKLNIPSIKEHLDSVQHCTVANVNKLKIKYYCEVCVKHYSMETSWDNHLVDLTHIARYNNLGKDRREHMIEYECLTCKLVIFGDQISLKRHITGVPRKKAKEITLPQSIVHLLASQNSIIQNSEKLLLEANIASQSQDKEKQVCTALVKVIKEIYPMCKAYPFGSRVTGLGYCDSDLDVFLDIGDMYHGNQNQHPEDQAQIVKKVAKILQKHRNTFSDINKVAAARTPIVQVFHKDSEVDCDISFRHGLSVENTAFISLCLDLQPIMRPTMLYLKEWFAATNLSGLSSYALTMLMVFYFQTKGYLLSIKELRHINPESSNIIDGWETIKYSVSLQTMKEYVNKCEYTVIQLMKNFFEYYATFDFEKWVICPLMGYLISKGHFNGYGTSLPMEMSRYVTKLYCTNPEYFRNLTPMCVQDPFDLSHNLTKACSKDMVRKFQAYCDLSKKHISAFN